MPLIYSIFDVAGFAILSVDSARSWPLQQILMYPYSRYPDSRQRSGSSSPFFQSETAGLGKRNSISVAKSGVTEALSNSMLNRLRSIHLLAIFDL